MGIKRNGGVGIGIHHTFQHAYLASLNCRIVRAHWAVVMFVGVLLAPFEPVFAAQPSNTIMLDNLNEPRVFKPDFEGSDYWLLTVTQQHGDALITVKDRHDARRLKRVSFSAHKGLNEYLLIAKDDCQACIVEVSASKPIDQDSSFQIHQRWLSESSTKSSEASLLALTLITKAGAARYHADNAKDDARLNYFRQSAQYLEKAAAETWQSDHDLHLHAQTLLAETLYFIGDKEKSIELLEKIRDYEAILKHQSYLIQSLYQLAAYKDNYQEKHALFEQGIALSVVIGNEQLQAMGGNYYAVSLIYNGDYQQALGLLHHAEQVFERRRNHRELVRVLFNLSWGHQRAGNPAPSLAYATQLQTIAKRYDDQEEALWAACNIASIYSQSGVYFEAENTLNSALKTLEALPFSQNSTLASLQAKLMQEKAELLLHFGDFKAAKQYVDQAIELFKRRSYQGRLTNLFYLAGEISLAMQDHQGAKEKLTESLQNASTNNQVRQIAKALLALADLNIQNNNLTVAWRQNQQALSLDNISADAYLRTRAVRQKTELLYRQGNYRQATRYAAQESVSFDQTRVHEYVRFRLFQGKALIEAGDLIAAKNNLNTARKIIDQALLNVKRADLRRRYLALHQIVYETSIAINQAAVDSNPERSIALAELFKARTLTEHIRASRVELDISSELIQLRGDLVNRIQRQVVEWYRQTGSQQRQLKIGAIEQSLAELEILNVAVNAVDGKRPVEHESDLGWALPDDQMIAYYFVGQAQSWLWTITQDRITAHDLPTASELDKLVTPIISTFSQPPTLRKNTTAWAQKQMLKEASEVFLYPLTEYLSHENIKHITVVASDILHRMPFAALSLKGDNRPIIDSYSVSFAHSLESLRLLEAQGTSWSTLGIPKAIVVADPLVTGAAGLPADSLHFSTQEAVAIQNALADSVILLAGWDANKPNFLDALSKPHDILHLATHGIVNMNEPALSGLVFSSGLSGDSLWSTSEIANTPINADLVVLSACEGAVGPHVAGEGLFSLSRAFIENGAKSVVGTLWKVQDQNAASIMQHFYAYFITQGLPLAESLRLAQREIYMDKHHNWKDPFFWAGFTLQGANLEWLNEQH